jgi:uncharacterized alpha-E superfamily protein
MLSRVAENLYWISRYVERAENVARLLDVGFHLELDAAGLSGGLGESAPIESVLTILACREAFEKSHGAGPTDREVVLRFLTFDREHNHSILSMLSHARENARASQETLSGDAWSQINRFYLTLGSARAQRRFAASPTRFLDGVKQSCILFAGLVDGTLPRTEVYHFLQLGRYLERVNQTSRVLNNKIHGLRADGPLAERTLQVVHWSSLLRSCSGYESYLRDHHDQIDPPGIVRYLVLNPYFPRSVRFCVARCLDSVRAISAGDDLAVEAERLLGRLDSELCYSDADEILDRGLPPFLVGIQDACGRIGDAIHHAYFST